MGVYILSAEEIHQRTIERLANEQNKKLDELIDLFKQERPALSNDRVTRWRADQNGGGLKRAVADVQSTSATSERSESPRRARCRHVEVVIPKRRKRKPIVKACAPASTAGEGPAIAAGVPETRENSKDMQGHRRKGSVEPQSLLAAEWRVHKDRITQCTRCCKKRKICKFGKKAKGGLHLSCVQCVQSKVKCEYEGRGRDAAS
ncbi:hypothetical protein P389DRAFT_58442 [Cystobasidium minutum MCA 4210]|uniref:uncharacterized protein n=1 Tax=Cystobasidium minutum MCA 4210 TaxID=1397322 RepID=UPI0034CF2B2D|eukprot:jgi/Rhomi1/58442/CE58441_355